MFGKYKTVLETFIRDESGATAIEYALLTTILAVGLIVGIGGIAIIVTDMWDGIDGNITGT